MKILVINNDLMERSVIQQVLQSNKHEVISAGNTHAAFQLLKDGDIRFVIADRATTDIDEQGFIKRLREANPPYYIYILQITPKVSDTDISNSNLGADDYLHKPVVPIELKSRVQIGERILGLGDNLLQVKDALDHTAMFDPLTNMLNQKAFLSLSVGELERARRNQAPLSLIALNVHNLTEISARHGETVANDVLVVIAQSIREKSRPYDGAAHYEKDLFLIPIPFVIGQDAEKIASRLHKGILNTGISLLDGTAVEVKITIGVVSIARVTVNTEMETLIEKAGELLAHMQRTRSTQVETLYL